MPHFDPDTRGQRQFQMFERKSSGFFATIFYTIIPVVIILLALRFAMVASNVTFGHIPHLDPQHYLKYYFRQ
jgi:hypothetical protein